MEARCAGTKTLAIRVELKGRPSQVPPEVRLWVDTSSEPSLDGEVEVALERTRARTWTGTIAFEHLGPTFFYRLGISAAVGLDWSLRIHDRDVARDLVTDGDRLTLPKCWLLGTCASRPQRGTVTQLDVARARRQAALSSGRSGP